MVLITAPITAPSSLRVASTPYICAACLLGSLHMCICVLPLPQSLLHPLTPSSVAPQLLLPVGVIVHGTGAEPVLDGLQEVLARHAGDVAVLH